MCALVGPSMLSGVRAQRAHGLELGLRLRAEGRVQG